MKLTRLNAKPLGERSAGVVALVAILSLLATACTPAPTTSSGATAPPAAAPPLSVALSTEPTSLDPSIDPLRGSLIIDNTMLESLAVNTPEQSYKPWLAESWEATAPTTWRVKLKKGVQFHNGEAFNADAVVFSLGIFLKTKSSAATYFNFMSDAQKVDDYTVDFNTKVPTAIFPATLAYLYVFPPKYYAETGADFGKKPVGTGPWKFVTWDKGVQLKVEPNTSYWGPKPKIGAITIRWASDASARVALVETGEVQLAQGIPPALIDRINNSGTAQAVTTKSIRKAHLSFNINDGPFADVRVRQAVNYAIDVESIIKNLFLGRAYGRDKGVIWEGMNGYQGDKLTPFKYDPEMAKKLLADAGYPNGFSTIFWHTNGNYVLDKESSQAMISDLAKVGIKAEDRGLEAGAYFSKINGEKVPGIVLQTCAPLFMDPLFCARLHLSPDSVEAYGANQRTAQILVAAAAELDTAKRAKLYQDLENYVYNEEVPWVWLWSYQDAYGVSNKINFTPRSDQLMDFAGMTFK